MFFLFYRISVPLLRPARLFFSWGRAAGRVLECLQLCFHSPMRPRGLRRDRVHSFEFAECRRGSDMWNTSSMRSGCVLSTVAISRRCGDVCDSPKALRATHSANTHLVRRQQTCLLQPLYIYSKWSHSLHVRSTAFVVPTSDDKTRSCIDLVRPLRLQVVETPRIFSRNMNLVKFSVLCTGHHYPLPPQQISLVFFSLRG